MRQINPTPSLSDCEAPVAELFLQRCLHLYRKNRAPLLSTWIVGLLTYMYAFTNKLVNLDEVAFLFSKGATIESGRWALELLVYCFPNFSMPWIYGIISLCIMGAANCILLKELKIQSPVLQILFSGLVISFPTMISTVTYMFTLSAYCIAFLLSVLAVRYANHHKWHIKLTGIVCAFLSMSLYQPFVSVTSSFFLVILIRDLIVEEKGAGSVFRKGLVYLAFLFAACVLYFSVNHFVQTSSGIGFGAYAQARLNLDAAAIISRLKRTYTVFLSELLHGAYGFMSTPFARLIHLFCGLLVGIGMVTWVIGQRDIRKVMLLVLFLLLLPVSISCLILVVEDAGVQTLLFYSFTSIYALVCIVIAYIQENCKRIQLKNLFFDLSSLFLSLILTANIYVGNIVSLRMDIAQKNCYAFFTNLVGHIEDASGFSPDSRIALIGRADQHIYDMGGFADANIPVIRAAEGFNINAWSREEFIKYYVGYEFDYASDQEVSAIIRTAEFSEMPDYPYEGSIRKIGDIIVVKFSDPTMDDDSIG